MKKVFNIFFLLALSSPSIYAQCAMCKASAESSLQASSQAAGINTGVLYVLVFAFIALSFFGFLFYKGMKASDASDA